MRYWQSYRFVFTNPNWPTNLALAAVCSLIPVLGQIVLIGYCFEVVERLLRRRLGRADTLGEGIMDVLPADEDYPPETHPDFSFDRFSNYLTRGIWPFLVQLIKNMVVGMIAGIFLMLGMMLAGFAAAAANSVLMFFVVYGLFWVVYALLMIVAGILTTPMYLHAGLSGDFSAAFSMDFYRDFMKRVGKEVVLTEAFLMATGTLAGIVGLLMYYIGIFPAIALVMIAHHHLEYQLYELYRERGGAAVEPREKPPVVLEEDRDSDAVSPRPRRHREGSTDIMREEDR
jgi:hypothetical protein